MRWHGPAAGCATQVNGTGLSRVTPRFTEADRLAVGQDLRRAVAAVLRSEVGVRGLPRRPAWACAAESRGDVGLGVAYAEDAGLRVAHTQIGCRVRAVPGRNSGRAGPQAEHGGGRWNNNCFVALVPLVAVVASGGLEPGKAFRLKVFRLAERYAPRLRQTARTACALRPAAWVGRAFRPAARVGHAFRPSARVGCASRQSAPVGCTSRPSARVRRSSRRLAQVGRASRRSARAGYILQRPTPA
jgi:hypothetical protein